MIPFSRLKAAISNEDARWTPREYDFLSKPESLRTRLGVKPDPARVAERSREDTDIVRLALQHQVAPRFGGRLTYDALFGFIADWLANSNLKQVDWRNRNGRNYVTPVKDQGACGSCVAFCACATLESMLLIERGVSRDLSEATLFFCGGGNCQDGWYVESAIGDLTRYGVPLESHLPYQDCDMECQGRGEDPTFISYDTGLSSIESRKNYLRTVGPVMSVFSVYDDFGNYGSGVYSRVADAELLDLHCVEVVGFDDYEGCWICKNSWGPSWGENGFFRIAYGQCGIDSAHPFYGIGGATSVRPLPIWQIPIWDWMPPPWWLGPYFVPPRPPY